MFSSGRDTTLDALRLFDCQSSVVDEKTMILTARVLQCRLVWEGLLLHQLGKAVHLVACA